MEQYECDAPGPTNEDIVIMEAFSHNASFQVSLEVCWALFNLLMIRSAIHMSHIFPNMN